MPIIDSTAIVDPLAQLADTVTVGPYSVIGPDVKIGNNTVIHSHVVITGHTTLGSGNQIYSHAVIGSPPQDKKYTGEYVELLIGNDNIIREFVTLNPGTGDGGGKTIIGNQNLLMAYVHVAHDCQIGDRCILANSAQLAGHVELHDDVVFGGMSGVHQFVRIGKGAMLGGGSMSANDIPPYCLASGNRASLQGLNLIGLKRAQMPRQVVDQLKESYRIFFRQDKPWLEALTEIETRFETCNEVLTFTQFLRQSKRGFLRPKAAHSPVDQE